MIQLKISGRAGNQFFQYAFVNNYMRENNIEEDIYVSFEHFKRYDNTFRNELENFNISNIKTIPKVHLNFKQKVLDFLFKMLNKVIRWNAKLNKRALNQKDYNFIIKILQKEMNKNGLYYYIPGMNKFNKSNTNNIIFFGAYEDNNYFLKDRDDILDKYTPKKEEIAENFQLYEVIKNTNSICVTIRRGDFLNPNLLENYYVCNREYFEKSMDKMNQLVFKPQYIVFSDDIEWCKKNINFPDGTMFESGKDPTWEKIRLMYSCKNFIISNSTFSWWAQFLSRNEHKIVIAPKKWNNFEYCDLIYDEKWNLI